MHVADQNKSIMHGSQINQPVNEVTYVGPPPKPVYFCMN